MIKTVALVANVMKKGAGPACRALIRFLKSRRVAVIADTGTAALVGDRAAARDDDALRAEAGLMVSLGGDGMVLKAARILQGVRVPLMGVNLGGLGFLTAATLGEAKDVLGRTLRGECRPEERLLLQVSLVRRGSAVARHVVLNDAVIAKGTLSRLVMLETFIDRQYLCTFISDGLVISSPTGSTAYSLSAGGPLVSPDMDAIIITPICPHALTNRPFVVPGRRKIRVRVSAPSRDNMLTLDGQVSVRLRDGDDVIVTAHGERLLLLSSPGKNYYQILRDKLHWGSRNRHG